MLRKILPVFSFIIIASIGCGQPTNEKEEGDKEKVTNDSSATSETIHTESFGQKNPRKLEFKWKTDPSKHSAPFEEFLALMERDGIPPIDEPKFWNKNNGDKVYFEHEPVIAIEIEGEAKAYPLSVLMFHEIVNDKIGGVPVTATYCPLCNAAIVFDRRLTHNGEEHLLDFGVSGMLRNSDMVMWDRQTESWWQQFTGEALVGELTGAELTWLPSMLISYEEFFTTYPDGWILSTETGHDMEYGMNPYVSYDSLGHEKPRLFKGEVDERLPAMERIINVNANGTDVIYPLSTIQTEKVINDEPHGFSVVIFHQSGTVSVLDKSDIRNAKDIGSVTVFNPNVDGKKLTFFAAKSIDTENPIYFRDEETGSGWSIAGKCIDGELKGQKLQPIVHGNHFAFAWFAFQPECEIYGQK
jgi:hypothetical protein